MIGRLALAAFSSSGQSIAEQLAILRMSKPISTMMSIESSSNGVQMLSMPLPLTSLSSTS